jgi:hypothetical protein
MLSSDPRPVGGWNAGFKPPFGRTDHSTIRFCGRMIHFWS